MYSQVDKAQEKLVRVPEDTSIQNIFFSHFLWRVLFS